MYLAEATAFFATFATFATFTNDRRRGDDTIYFSIFSISRFSIASARLSMA
jgi:hypothetical protein